MLCDFHPYFFCTIVFYCVDYHYVPGTDVYGTRTVLHYCTVLHVRGRPHSGSFYLFLSIITHLPLPYSSCPEHYCHAVHPYSFIIWLLIVCLCVRVLKILHNCASIFWLTRHFFLLVLINCPCSFHYQVNTNPHKFSSTTTTPTTTLVSRTNHIIRSNQLLVLSWR